MPSLSSLAAPFHGLPINKLSVHATGQEVIEALPSINATNCWPPTPADELHAKYEVVRGYMKSVETIIQSLNVYKLNMAPFAQAVNTYLAYVKSISQTMCINANNQIAYDGLDRIIAQTNNLVTSGISIFEKNLNTYASGAIPLLQNILTTCQGINNTSKDFTLVSDATERYNGFNTPYSVDIYYLSQVIASTADKLNALSAQADQAVGAAMAQLEINVEREVEVIVQKALAAGDLIKYWDNIDGESGYKSYKELVKYTEDTLVPHLENFLKYIPSTYRVQASIQKAEQAVEHIKNNFNAFPEFMRLPPPSGTFPYVNYSQSPNQRQFGEAGIIAVLQASCLAYFNATGRQLSIGDMQLKHGGRIVNSAHRSHKVGRDADVDVTAAGDVGNVNYNSDEALLAAQCFLQAGAILIFYAETTVIASANQWAISNGIQGRLQFEANHTRHFHLRSAL